MPHHFLWQQVYAAAMDRGKSVAKAGQRERVVADAADHIFRLPHISPGDTDPRMQCVEPAKTNDGRGRRWRKMARFLRLPEHEPEGRRQRPEFARGHESEIHLQSGLQKKYAVDPCPRTDVNMMQGAMLTVHVRRPVGQHFLQLDGIPDAECKIDVRPPVFAFRGRRPGDRSTADALVACGEFQQAGPQAGTFFHGKHKPSILLHRPATTRRCKILANPHAGEGRKGESTMKQIALAAAILICSTRVDARVIRIVIEQRESPAFRGQAFGPAGQFETLSGRFYGELDPKDPHNAIITDIQFAPRNARGMVEYSATFAISKPIDMSKSSGVLFYTVPNRGGGSPRDRRKATSASSAAGRATCCRARAYNPSPCPSPGIPMALR